MSKYLLLGGNGFIGRNLIHRLSVNNEIVVLDIQDNENYINNKNVIYKKIDFTKCDDFASYIKGVDVVIHLFSTITPNVITENINQEIADNVFPTIRLLDAVKEFNDIKIVFISSGGCVYGEHNIEAISELEKKEPICNYGIIKDLIEKYFILYERYYGINYRIIRLANPYSGKIYHRGEQGIIPILIDKIKNQELIEIWGDGNDIIRDYIYIEDAIEAIIKIVNYSGKERIFNVGTGKGCTLNQLIEIIKKQLKVTNINISYLDNRLCDVKNNILNIDKIKKEINWEPKYTLEEGINKIILEDK